MTDPWLCEDKPFNFTSTGYIGSKRAEMLDNYLLVKSRLGVARNRDPHICNKTHGACFRDHCTAAHAVTGWAGTLPQITKKKKIEKRTRDYLQLNRGAESAAMTTSAEFGMYKKSKRHIDSLLGSYIFQKQERPKPKAFKPDDVFGKPSGKGDNMVDLLAHEFQRQWLKNAKEETLQEKFVIDFTKVRPTRASLLKPQMIKTGVDSRLWRSPVILDKAQPSISSFRSEKALKYARACHSLESVGREGATGQGIIKTSIHDHCMAYLPDSCPQPGLQNNAPLI